MADQTATTIPLTLEHIRAIYRAGITEGVDEATAFEWGSTRLGHCEDELADALHEIVNEGRKWGEPGYVEYFGGKDIDARWPEIASTTPAGAVG